MKKTLLGLALLVSSLFTLMAQSDDLGFEGNIDRMAGIYHSYEAAQWPQTPAPKGFKPVYVSHYGRHGSRRQTDNNGAEAYQIFSKASEAGVLTEEGRALYKDIEILFKQHEGMEGELTIRGGIEHKGVAERMYERFKPVFKGKKTVHCQSSVFRRCIVSMAYFTSQLKECAPKLELDFITGEKYIDTLCHNFYDRHLYLAQRPAIADSLGHACFNPSRIMKAFFTDSPKVKEIVPDPWLLGQSLFKIMASGQNLQYETGGLELYKYFTEEELIGLAKQFNEIMYSSIGNNLKWGDNVIWAEKWLLEDIIAKADKALSGGNVAADLRFGHDSAVWPLASLIGLDGVSGRYKIGEAWKNGLYTWQVIPMCTNMQFAFYKNRKGEVLVKILYNEKEHIITDCFIPGATIPQPVHGPYYKWDELRSYFVYISKDKTFGK